MSRSTLGIVLAALAIIELGSPSFGAPIVPITFSGQPAPGAPPGQVFQQFLHTYTKLNDLGQVAFVGELTAHPGPDGGRLGIWSGAPRQLAVVARTGTPAPGVLSDSVFTDVRGGLDLNNHGHVAWIASASGISSGGRGVWSNASGSMQLVARHGDSLAVGSLQSNLDEIWRIGLDDYGRTVFHSTVSSTPRHQAIWREEAGQLSFVASTRTQAPGMPDGTAFLWRNFIAMSTNRVGDVAISAVVTDQPDGPPNRSTGQGIWSDASGALQLVVRNGAPFPPGAPGEIFTSQYVATQDPVALNDHGQIAHVAGLQGATVTPQNDSAIVVHANTGVELFLREGDAAPGTEIGTLFTGFHLPRLNNAGLIAFTGLVNSTNEKRSGIWSGAKHDLQLVARENAPAPGTSPQVVFSYLASDSQPALNDAGQVAFAARLRGPDVNASNDVGIWGLDPLGVLTLIAREGDAIEVAPSDFRIVQGLNLSSSDPNVIMPVHLNARGQVAFHARFTDGSQGIFLSNALAVPEPTAIGLLLSLMLLKPRCPRRAA